MPVFMWCSIFHFISCWVLLFLSFHKYFASSVQFLDFDCFVLLGKKFIFVYAFVKLSASGPDIFLYVVRTVCECGAIDYVFVLAYTIDRAVGFYPTITSGSGTIVRIQKFFIVPAYDGFNVGDTAV